MAVPRSVQTQFGLALLFVLLGTGNIIFGSWKTKEYQELLSKAQMTLASPKDESAPTHVTAEALPEPLAEKWIPQGAYESQIKARFDFYQFVTLGGRWILAVAGFFLLLALVGLRETPPPSAG
jgi:hypothetical protein